jgi:hypothetical protein
MDLMNGAGGWVQDVALHWQGGPACDSAACDTATTRPARHEQK